MRPDPPSTDPLAALTALPGVQQAAASTRAAVDGMLAHRVLRRRGEQVAGESVLRGAWAAATLGAGPTGHGIDLDALRGGDPGTSGVQGALRVYGELGALATTWAHSPAQALARAHLLAAAGLVADPSALGRPSSPAAAQRLAVLGDVLGATSAPAVLVAAVVHGELLATRAFDPAGEVVAAVALRLVLIDRGLDPSSRSVPEVGLREGRADRDAALAAYSAGGADGITTWVQWVAGAVRLGARETVAICEALQR